MKLRPLLALTFSATCAFAAGCGDNGTAMMTPADMALPGISMDLKPENADLGHGPGATTAVVTTSSLMTFGALNTVRLADKTVTKQIDTTLDQDNAVEAQGGKVLVLDRTHGSLRVYDPGAAFKSPIEIATGDMTAPNGKSNPHDAVLVPATSKIYVAMYGNDADHAVGLVDTTQPAKGVLKWIAVPKAGSPLPRANNLYFCGPYVYVVLEDLDAMYGVTGPGRIAVIDPKTDALVMDTPIITLAGKNPGSGTQFAITQADPKAGSCDLVLVANGGDFNVPKAPNGGGIEVVDLTRRKSLGLLLTDKDLGGDPGSISTVNANLAYAIINNADFTQKVVAIDPMNKKVLGDVFGPSGFLTFAQASPDGQLFVGAAKGDMAKGQPAIGLYVGPADGMKLSATAIDLGQAPYAVSFY